MDWENTRIGRSAIGAPSSPQSPVWGGMSSEVPTDLHVIAHGTLTAVRYLDKILRGVVRPYGCDVESSPQ